MPKKIVEQQGLKMSGDTEALLAICQSVIDEFPQFTFLLADIHPHMLGMPFVLIAIALALNFIHGGAEGRFKMAKLLVAYEPLAVFFAVLTLGGIAFMNTWDFPFYLA